jgi:glycogen debranching enzyme
MVGLFFQVVEPSKAASVLESLRANETQWGVRESFPYVQVFEPHTGEAGNYHNGGIWPWINFVDVTGRYLYGRAADAERIIRNLARADLLQDWTPHEYLNGDTGTNRGYPIQGWNGAIFAALYRGAFGIERTSATELRIRPRVIDRDFDTWLVLPGGTARIKRANGVTQLLDVAKSFPYRLILDESAE